MARMSVDDSFLRDPRVKKLAKLCGWSRRETMGALLDVWAVAYDRAQPTIPAEEIDLAAELDGFTAKMVEAGLAQRTPGGRGGGYDGDVWISGVSKRVEYLAGARAKGAEGGRKSGEVRRGSRKPFKGVDGDPQGSTNLPDTATVPDAVPDAVPERVSAPEPTRARDPKDTDTATWSVDDRRKLADKYWDRLARLRLTLAAEFGQTDTRALHPQDRGRTELQMRMLEAGPDRAEADVDHVLRVLEAEARRSRSVEWVSGGAFGETSWRRKLAMTPTDAARTAPDRKPGASIGPAAPRSDHPDGTFVDFGDAT